MVLKPIIFVLLMQIAEASYLFAVTMKLFNRIALGHTYIHMLCSVSSNVATSERLIGHLD